MFVLNLVFIASLQPTFVLQPAEGEDGVVAVMPVQSQSGLGNDRERLVDETLGSELPGERLAVLPGGKVQAQLAGLESPCADTIECNRSVAESLGADYWVSIIVEEPSPQDFELSLVVFTVVDGEELARFEETCTICSETDLQRVVRERALDAQLALQRSVAPDEFDDEPAVETVVVEGPVTTQIEVRLERRSRLTPAGWAFVGAGTVATAGGAVLLALTGGDAGCHDDPRGGGCLPLVYDTLVPGIVAGSVGLAFVGTGIGLLAAAKRKDERRAQGLSGFGVGPGSVTLQGKF